MRRGRLPLLCLDVPKKALGEMGLHVAGALTRKRACSPTWLTRRARRCPKQSCVCRCGRVLFLDEAPGDVSRECSTYSVMPATALLVLERQHVIGRK